MHVLIVEAALSGHHPVYLERLASAFMERGDRVTVAVSDRDASHPSIDRLKLAFGEMFFVHAISSELLIAASTGILGDISREFGMRRVFGVVYGKVNAVAKVDHVFVPYVDYCLYALGLLGSPFDRCPWSGITMRPSFHYAVFEINAPLPKMSRTKKYLFSRLLREPHLRTLFTIDELLKNFVDLQLPLQSGVLRYLPDPAELTGVHDRASARAILTIPEGDRVVLCYGAIDSRKGLDRLIDLLDASPSSDKLSVIVAGQQSEWARMLVSRPRAKLLIDQRRLIIIDRFLNEVEQQMVFAACDTVWIAYRQHYTMSGVVVLAARAGKPVIATDEGLIAWYVKKYRMGHLIPPSVSEPNLPLIALTTSWEHNKEEVAAKFATHNWNDCVATITENIN